MWEIGSILVPVDFSEHSERALADAIELAKVFRAEIHLLHCVQLNPGAVSPYGIVVPETFEHDVRQAALRRLAEWRGKVESEGVAVSEHVTAHFPAEEIAAMAKKLGVGLIVMGTRGLSGLKHVLLGSVAERTLRSAPCPVWVARGGP